ncbi:MAG: hypothetical protein GDA41_06865 [Rhodospirillales bacterium]|nr:hypothetical protein [Rhodospirillales bacterium]
MISGFIALLLSVAWLAASAYFLDRYAGLQNLMAFSPFEQAMILAGLSAPLCLLWILTTWIGNGLKLRALRREVRALRALVVRVAPPSAFEGSRMAGSQQSKPMPSAASTTPTPRPDDVRKVMKSLERVTTPVQEHSEGAEAAAPAPAPATKPAAQAPEVAAETPKPAPGPAKEPAPKPAPAPAAKPAAQAPKVAAEAPKSAPGPAKEPALSMAKTPRPAPPKAQAAAGSGAPVLGQMEALVDATKRDLNALANDLVFCLRSEKDHASALSAYNGGQKDAFFAVLWEHLRRSSRNRTALALQESGAADMVTAYRQKFEGLAKEVQSRDSSGQALRSLRRQPMGLVYEALRDRLG